MGRAEVSSYRLRLKAQAVRVVSNAAVTWFFTFIVPCIYNTDASNLGARTGFVFMGTSILLFVGSLVLGAGPVRLHDCGGRLVV